ncbi:hypothetical protein [Christiangramia forsetii]|uniref:Secreted protein n=2 Tax=Christiangramia forsetii TaxID=411153 RepID=A0M6F3_CHRFK|nr:hypothetical protein [Christiangramia forsetii]GGG30554.1 hypothetical protein GCM10011532_12590 [Christiangramia forsetii]CAL68198.1 secreted protein [Christiangramia forsetii KT0803]
MISNIKLILIFSLLAVALNAQEENRYSNQYSENPETVFFNAEIYYPVSLGSSVYSNYKFDPGYALDFNWFFKPKFTLGARVAVHRIYPENISATGNFQRGTFHLLGADFGYYKPINKEWNLHYKSGIGIISNVYTAAEDKFSEDGGKLWLSAEIARRLDKTFGIFLKTGIDYDFTNIETSAARDSYFNNNFLFTIGIGLRFNFQNPGG